MNLARITELQNLLIRLYEILKELMTRKDNLEQEVPRVNGAQEHLEYAVSSAKNRVSALETFGLRQAFLEEVIRPVQNRPDCSGIGVTVQNEISAIKEKIQQTNGQIRETDQEKTQLEMEVP